MGRTFEFDVLENHCHWEVDTPGCMPTMRSISSFVQIVKPYIPKQEIMPPFLIILETW